MFVNHILFKQWANGNSEVWQKQSDKLTGVLKLYGKPFRNYFGDTLKWAENKAISRPWYAHSKPISCNLDALTLSFTMLGTTCFKDLPNNIWQECLLHIGARLAMKLTLAISFINIHPQMGMHLECDNDCSQ